MFIINISVKFYENQFTNKGARTMTSCSSNSICDLDLRSTMLKHIFVPHIVALNICVKLNENLSINEGA